MKKHLKKSTLSGFGFLVLIVLANGHLFHLPLPQLLVYDHGKVLAGQWWRIVTYPLVHVSWYHLVLDVSATLLLWLEIKHLSVTIKLILVSYLSLMVLAISILFSPYLATSGLCGLSGLAHGLGVFVGFLQMERGLVEKPRGRNLPYSGLIVSGAIIFKCIYEGVTGQIVFNTFHFGDLGLPIIHAHLGGALGGLSFLLVFRLTRFGQLFRPQAATPARHAQGSALAAPNQLPLA